MTTRFRIESVELSTSAGVVRYNFDSELTVLAGDPGVGKTTLLELIKFGLGGNAALADVTLKHITDVTLDLAIGESRLRLSRSINPQRQNTVRVTDLITQDQLPDHHIGDGAPGSTQPSLNSLLMGAIGLPDDMRAASSKSGSDKPGNRITFSDVFSFLYIPQAAINREIAHSEESYREPKRKAVFELLFGITDTSVLSMQSQINSLNAQISSAEVEYRTVISFLHDSNSTGREEAERAISEAESEESRALAEQASLREEVDPSGDRETLALRDLLKEAELSLSEARDSIKDLIRQHDEYSGERRRVQSEVTRLQRMSDAGQRLAQIEFSTCPRCMQSLTHRDVPAGRCRVCLQEDPVAALPFSDSATRYEMVQLTEQVAEIDDHLDAISDQLSLVNQAVADREEVVKDLTARIDARTASRATPRLQAFADAADRLAVARTRQQYLEQVLRQWDRVDDLSAAVQGLRAQKDQILIQIEDVKSALASRRANILTQINAEFMSTVAEFGIPGVESAEIHQSNYLPILNGRRYTKFSGPGGGIITATQVAYWLSLLTVAQGDDDSLYPAFLMLDSPRLAMHDAETVTASIYRRLVKQADTSRVRIDPRDKVQFIIADNRLPKAYRRDYAEIEFTYDNPTVSTIEHPGLDAVNRITVG